MNRPIDRVSVDAGDYYDRAASWDHDVRGGLVRWARVAWCVAAAACAIAVLEAMALIALTPLKTVVPYAFVVDRQTGFIEAVRPLQAGALSQDAAVTQSYLAQYVLARETFDLVDLKDAYRRTLIWSAVSARDDYLKQMAASNPDSPQRVYPKTTRVQVSVKSISLLRPGSALVRFSTDRSDAGASAERRDYAAVIGYRFTGRPMRMGERLENPLGFEVTSYRRDAESFPIPPKIGSVP
jgi:type IV secretion system protein VirB8